MLRRPICSEPCMGMVGYRCFWPIPFQHSVSVHPPTSACWQPHIEVPLMAAFCPSAIRDVLPTKRCRPQCWPRLPLLRAQGDTRQMRGQQAASPDLEPRSESSDGPRKQSPGATGKTRPRRLTIPKVSKAQPRSRGRGPPSRKWRQCSARTGIGFRQRALLRGQLECLVVAEFGPPKDAIAAPLWGRLTNFDPPGSTTLNQAHQLWLPTTRRTNCGSLQE